MIVIIGLLAFAYGSDTLNIEGEISHIFFNAVLIVIGTFGITIGIVLIALDKKIKDVKGSANISEELDVKIIAYERSGKVATDFRKIPK
jgi:hypothetical protein